MKHYRINVNEKLPSKRLDTFNTDHVVYES